jgi:hypothetical protein
MLQRKKRRNNMIDKEFKIKNRLQGMSRGEVKTVKRRCKELGVDCVDAVFRGFVEIAGTTFCVSAKR